jgi:hypothetical protein
MELALTDEDSGTFRLDGKQVVLNKPLDRDEQDLASIMFQVSVFTPTSNNYEIMKKIYTSFFSFYGLSLCF